MGNSVSRAFRKRFAFNKRKASKCPPPRPNIPCCVKKLGGDERCSNQPRGITMQDVFTLGYYRDAFCDTFNMEVVRVHDDSICAKDSSAKEFPCLDDSHLVLPICDLHHVQIRLALLPGASWKGGLVFHCLPGASCKGLVFHGHCLPGVCKGLVFHDPSPEGLRAYCQRYVPAAKGGHLIEAVSKHLHQLSSGNTVKLEEALRYLAEVEGLLN